jgi:hypothetical protein
MNIRHIETGMKVLIQKRLVRWDTVSVGVVRETYSDGFSVQLKDSIDIFHDDGSTGWGDQFRWIEATPEALELDRQKEELRSYKQSGHFREYMAATRTHVSGAGGQTHQRRRLLNEAARSYLLKRYPELSLAISETYGSDVLAS